jgi:tRNA 2-thiouridine synthesizing protein A
MTAVATLDCEGMLCPLPVLKARKRLLQMVPGSVLAVRATDPMAAIDVPHFCAEAGHNLLQTLNDGAVRVYVIQRGPNKS